jgi:hypothetical protein
MTRNLLKVLLVCTMLPTLAAGNVAVAQTMIPPGWSQFSPPPPAPPPSPKIEVPVVPKFGELPRQTHVQPSSRGSFSDRITSCLQDEGAAGLRPGARDSYSRACANR